MALDMCGRPVLICVLLSLLCVSSIHAGECCKAYTDVAGELHSPEWCSDFCCYDYKTLGLTYYCCSNDILRADQNMRDTFCIQWWAAHIYVPILIGVAVLIVGILTCCCCCCCGCCRRRGTGYVIQTQGSGAPVVMVQQQQRHATTLDPFRTGYDQ